MAAASALDIREAGVHINSIFLETENSDVREVAILAMGVLKFTEAKKDLENTLDDPSERVALSAAESLGRMGNASGYPVAIYHLNHSKWFIRRLAARAIGYIETEGVIEELEAHLNRERSPGVRSEVEISMNRISIRRMEKSKRLNHLQRLLDSKNRFISRWAHYKILNEFPDESISIFRKRAQDKERGFKKAAVIYQLRAEERAKEGDGHE
jgi:HEAT repeat protein